MKLYIMMTVGLMLSACVQTQKIPGQQIDNSYSASAFAWESGQTVYIFAKAVDHGKRVVPETHNDDATHRFGSTIV